MMASALPIAHWGTKPTEAADDWRLCLRRTATAQGASQGALIGPDRWNCKGATCMRSNRNFKLSSALAKRGPCEHAFDALSMRSTRVLRSSDSSFKLASAFAKRALSDDAYKPMSSTRAVRSSDSSFNGHFIGPKKGLNINPIQ